MGREGAIGGIVSAGFKPAYGRAVVRVPGFAFCIPTARLEDAKGQSPALADLFARYADVLLAQMMQSTACNALHGVEQRYCRWLLSTHDRAGDEPIRLTQETLAQMMGVQRTTVTAVARALQDDGLIATGRGRIEVLDRPALERRACECHDAVERHFQRTAARGRYSPIEGGDPADRRARLGHQLLDDHPGRQHLVDAARALAHGEARPAGVQALDLAADAAHGAMARIETMACWGKPWMSAGRDSQSST